MPRSHPAVQLYTVRHDLENDLAATLESLARIGVTDVEPYGLGTFGPRLKGPLEALGLATTSAHGSMVSDPAVTVAAATALGVGTVYEPSQPPERFSDRGALEDLARDLNHAAAVATDSGLGFGYHNHWWELEAQIDGAPALLVLADLVSPEVTFEVDVYWAAVGGADVLALLAALGQSVTALHVKDGPISRDISKQLPAGEGRMKITEILAAAPHARRVLEFDDFDGDIVAALARSLAFVEHH